MSINRCIINLEPCRIEGIVVHGYRRGTTLLDCPTANISADNVSESISHFKLGVYFGWVSLHGVVYKMVANIGKNPSFNNGVVSVEIHLLHSFDYDFYDDHLKVLILGSIRTESKFSCLEELKTAIHEDCGIAETLLDEEQYISYSKDTFLLS